MKLPDQPKRRPKWGVKLPRADSGDSSRCYLYARCSRGFQELSIPAQLKVMRAQVVAKNLSLGNWYFYGAADYYCPGDPEPRFTGNAPVHGVFVDQAVSAFSTNLADRPGGQRLLTALQPGDTVMVSRLDRMFRSMEDFCLISDWFIQHDVRLIVCDSGIDLGTATGRLLARNLANLAQWESERRSERIREALAQKKLRDGLTPDTPTDRRPPPVTLPSEYRPVERPTLELDTAPGRIFIYLRVSHRESAQSGLGLMAQLANARAYAEALIAANPQLYIAEVYTDPAQSAWKHNLNRRPAGHSLCEVIGSGDHVVFATLDRGFRSVRDLANTLPDWTARGITAHFAGEGINMADAGGRLLAHSIVQFAEYEAEITSARTREARAVMVAQGKFVGGRDPVFWNLRRYGRFRRLELNRKRIAEYRLLRLYRQPHRRFLIDGKIRKPSLDDCLRRLEHLLARREGRVELPLTGARPGSKLLAALPDNYPRDDRGTAFPRWTRDRWYDAREHYEPACEKWRAVAAERKRLRRETTDSPATETSG